MNKNNSNRSTLPANPDGTIPVTRAMVHDRARELALIADRPSSEVTRADYDQAQQELTGESDLDRQDAMLDALPETKRWDPVPGSEGQQARESPSEDEDEEGRSETEQLVDKGAAEAGRDRMMQSARAAGKNK